MSQIADRDASGASSCIGMQDRARELALGGRDVVHLDRGELDFETPEPIVDAAVQALRDRQTRYTHSTGSVELRRAIQAHYRDNYQVDIDPAQVFVHAGSSPLLLVLFLAILGRQDEVLVPDPGYPAYATCVRAAGGVPRPVRGDASFHCSAHDLARRIGPRTAAIVVNSPNNPTGAMLDEVELAAIAGLGKLVVSDEVYHALTLDGDRPHSILEFTRNAVVLNSFSKAFAMTGWRLGYVIVPPDLVPLLEPLQRDSVISPNAFVQQAGVAALKIAAAVASGWREELRRRREVLLSGLTRIGMSVPCRPSGGFYAFARMPDGCGSAAEFARRMLEEESVAVVAGSSFGPAGEGHIRCSFTPPPERIEQGIARMAEFLTRR